jgi:hypothetical protein
MAGLRTLDPPMVVRIHPWELLGVEELMSEGDKEIVP